MKILYVLSILLCMSCAPKTSFYDAEKERYKAEKVRAEKINSLVLLAIQHIVTEVQGQVTVTKNNKLWEKTVVEHGVTELNTVYYPSNSELFDYLKIREKMEMISTLFPIALEMYKSNIPAGKAPTSWQDVAKDLVSHTPILTLMGGMYGLGKVGIENAATKINADLSESQLSYGDLNDNDSETTFLPAEEGVE